MPLPAALGWSWAGPRRTTESVRIPSKKRENPWSGRHGERTLWPSARLRPHNDGMTGSLVATRKAGRHAGRVAGRDVGMTARAGTESGGFGSAPLLTVSGLNLSYGRLRALSDINLTVQSGELVALAGENGAGKTTLVRCIAGDVVPASGEIYLGGKRVPPDPGGAVRQGLAVVWQDLALCDNLDIAANIMLGRESRRLMRSEARFHAVAASLLAELHISLKDTTRSVRWLSGGQRQLVAVARAMGRRPRLLVLDEPTASLGV